MAKKPTIKNLLKSLSRCAFPGVILLILIAFGLGAYAQNKNNSNPTKSVVLVKAKPLVKAKTKPAVSSTTAVAAPPAATAATPAATTKPKSIASAATPTHVTSSSKPAPVIVPAPSSSVSSLTPTSTSSTAPSSNSSGSSTGSSSSSSSTTQTTGYTSTNWSGYLAGNGTFTKVDGSWVVTSPTGNGSSNSADGTWIGIGGVSSSDLIQVGTDNSVSPSGHVSSEAFYEILPAASVTVPGVIVAPGDQMSASITETSTNQWVIYIIDNTNGQSWTDNLTYTSTNSSAEWIEEDPSYSNNRQVPFDNFGSVNFSAASATIGNSDLNLRLINAHPVTMVSSHTGQPTATPSAVSSDGSSFDVIDN